MRENRGRSRISTGQRAEPRRGRLLHVQYETITATC